MRNRLAALTAIAALSALAAGCGSEPSSDPGRSPSASSSLAPTTPAPPSTIPLDDESVPLAARITQAMATVASGPAGAEDVREAALFEQTAARDLARAPKAQSGDELGALGRADRTQLEADIAAARELMVMTDPQPKLPDWRIVTPPRPDELRRLYRKAQQKTGTPWEYLAAVHLVETRMGRIRGTSTAGAQGPMQFLPSTFAQYGAGGDINDPGDAIMAAGRMLANNGAPGDMSGALWSYNHSDRYVAAVSAYAEQMKRSPAAYDLYWHWQVLYRHQDGTMLLPEGYPDQKPVRID
ncbi:transglycosylase SLT domain-containing protein [Nocardioides sp.]|uniref:lytic transglycosylase domain-containing protein n=1 Tax=Nocardioides sp. TaxID=35761 RepID=UPI0019BDCD4C|nr:transglycosylase SLT domain-containing protein [Nocardioides sp.]MBC7279626.1 transglycosylase SLT domain-containing protein [Nocardioides sp.]